MLRTLGLLGAIYLVIVLALAACQRQFIYYPDSTRPDPATVPAPFEAVSYRTQDGLTLEGWYAPAADDQSPVIVYFQGNAGHAAHRVMVVDSYVERGWGVLLAGYRGYGGNPGRPNESGLMQDAQAAIAFLLDDGVDESRLVLYGESLGTGLAVALVTEENPARGDQPYRPLALVLQAPFTSLVDMGRRSFPIAPVGLLLRDRFETLPRMARVETPVLVLHGDQDGIIPPVMGERVAEAAAGPSRYVPIEGAGHNDMFVHDLDAIVVPFIDGVLAGDIPRWQNGWGTEGQ